ncbi:MAG: hypothetical protein E7578_06130 [Ruminococcaceae bacterium]|nr:hypothetical protein [Oscillospiraceae bacterium]
MADKKIETFLNTVYSAAEEKSQKMIREIDRAGDAALREYRSELQRYADTHRRRENAKAERIGAENVAHDESEIRQVIIDRREAITDEVFSEIKERLIKYRTTSDYKDALVRDAELIAERMEGCNACKLHVGDFDMEMAQSLESVTGIPVCADPAVKIGGVLGVCDEMELDCTLDSRLLLAREDFTKESGLSVV